MLDLTIVIKSIFLGFIEGLTEFIPVSSTAHLLITSRIIDFSYFKNDVFEIVIQLGAIMAVCFYYRQKIFSTLFSFHKNKDSRNFSINIFLAFFPAVIFGFLFYDIIKLLFFTPKSIAIALITGGLIIILVEKSKIKPKFHDIDKLPKLQSLYIGFFQIFAMIPGVSRSGATIIGSLLLKLDRKVATEFSFFLAIPTIFAATVYDLYKNYEYLDWSNFQIIIIGFLSAFFTSLLVIKWFIQFVSHNNFMIFAYYRIIIGTLILGFLLT